MKIPFIKNKAEYIGAGLCYPNSADTRDKFTLTSRFGDKVKLYKDMGNNLLVPRNCGNTYKEDRQIKGVQVNFNSSFIARDGQQELVNRSHSLLNNDESHIMEAATGSGKTIMGTEIAGRLGKKFLVIVPKSDIVDQWRNAFKLILGLKDNEIGLIQGDTYNVAGKKAVVAMIHSLCKDNRYPPWVYNEFGLIIIDECHVVSAETFANTMWLLPATLRLGLSATPYRQDGKDFVFHSHIGPIKNKSANLQLTPKILVKASDFVTPSVNKYVEINGVTELRKVKMFAPPGKTGALNKALARNTKRNKLIADLAKSAYQKGRNTIIFSELRESHLEPIETELIGLGVSRRDIGWYVGGMKKTELEKSKAKKIILSTYRMASMATDIPWLDTCILCTPRADVVQIVGRILREYPDKKEPVVFDIVDNDNKVFASYYKKRLSWYRKIGAKVVHI